MDGVVRTRVGYAGGSSENPSYYNLGQHSETIQIEYDPSVISYGDLLEVFWDSHSPVYAPYSRQYMSIVFYHDEEQKKLAVESKEQEEKRLGHKIYTEIMPYTEFYLAEDYHQKYYLRQESLLINSLRQVYTDETALINSTAAARLNGYVAGNGSFESLQNNLAGFGLSEEGEQLLLEIGRARLASSADKSCPIN
jgi:methionine-S-sulfoxide reductase